jgi:uncharacterized protein
MARDGLKILDSDMHLMEPVDLWERYIDSKFKSLGARGLTSENVRDLRMAHPDGRLWGLPQTRGQRNSNQGHNFRKNQGIYRSHAERGWTADIQLEAMDIEGIDVAVLYPTRGLQVLAEPNMEPQFAAALARAYNDWLHDFCEKNPNRLLGAGMISPFDMDRLVFSTDYPHGDSKFPHAVESFLKLEITQDDKRKILWDNCAEFYHAN